MAASGVRNRSSAISVQCGQSSAFSRTRALRRSFLGGTDLVLVYDERTSDFPLIDCASIHADAIARWRLARGLLQVISAVPIVAANRIEGGCSQPDPDRNKLAAA